MARAVVEHDACAFAHAIAAHRRRELLGGGHHETELRVAVGEIPRQVGKAAAGDVRGGPLLASGGGVEPTTLARSQEHRAVQDAQVRILEVCFEPVGFNQRCLERAHLILLTLPR